MRKAQSLQELLAKSDAQEEKTKGIEFLFRFTENSVEEAFVKPSDYNVVIHIAYCDYEKTDYFLAYRYGSKNRFIYSGYLNDGTY